MFVEDDNSENNDNKLNNDNKFDEDDNRDNDNKFDGDNEYVDNDNRFDDNEKNFVSNDDDFDDDEVAGGDDDEDTWPVGKTNDNTQALSCIGVRRLCLRDDTCRHRLHEFRQRCVENTRTRQCVTIQWFVPFPVIFCNHFRYSFDKPELHLYDLLWICCTTSGTTNPQQIV